MTFYYDNTMGRLYINLHGKKQQLLLPTLSFVTGSALILFPVVMTFHWLFSAYLVKRSQMLYIHCIYS